MDQAYGGTGSPRYYIVTAFQDVRMYVVLRLLLMGNLSTPVGQGLRGSPIKWQFLKHGPRKGTAEFPNTSHGYLPRDVYAKKSFKRLKTAARSNWFND